MSLIEMNDSVIDVMTKMSAGNIGAINVMMQIMEKAGKIDPQDFMGPLGAIMHLDTLKIYGPDIWILYKDISGSDIVNMLAILRACQLGIIPDKHVKDTIFDIREGRSGRQATQLHVPTILEAVMEQLEGFNRVKKEAAPDVPPSYFMNQGTPSCSIWGKTEIECLAHCYVSALAMDGDTWKPLTVERCKAIFEEQGFRPDFISASILRGAIDGEERDIKWWDMVAQQLTDAAGAFEVGGLAWTKRRYEQRQAAKDQQTQPAETCTTTQSASEAPC